MKNRTLKFVAFWLICSSLLICSCKQAKWQIVISPEDSAMETLAAKEVSKYLYQTTGILAPVVTNSNSESPRGRNIILIKSDVSMEAGEYSVKSDNLEGGNILTLSGGSPVATLYAAYELAEQLGVRFYLHGDVVPDNVDIKLIEKLDIHKKPLFKIRGIQPFHDFPEGPDWWSKEDYKAIIAQLPKLKMNFIGFHTYPEGGVGPEPLVWIGTTDQLYEDGRVKTAYRAKHMTTSTGTFGYQPKATSSYSHGSGQLFPADSYGSDYMAGLDGWSESDEEQVKLFNETGDFFGEVFEFAHTLGVKTCVGTETPLTIPSQVNERLSGEGTSLALYKGMFSWIKKNYPLDYYWFWTPEGWTWGGNTGDQIERTKNDLLAAQQAIEELGNPFQLATCGWVLGPNEDRAMFDDLLPKSWPMSCINRQVGFSMVEEGFKNVDGRPKWAIPWMEDDPAMIIPQLWVGRMRKDAADALAYGCDGLLGIHWRTMILGPNVSALAKAAWDQDYDLKEGRDAENIDFYIDWAVASFGPDAGEDIGSLFAGLDGVPGLPPESSRKANLPRPADWVGGPGGLVPDARPWEEAAKEYNFVEEFESFRPMIPEFEYTDRYNYWLNQFKYLRSTGKLCCSLGEFNRIRQEVESLDESGAAGKKLMIENQLLPVRQREMAELSEVYKYLLNSISTRGGLGNLANWEQHVWNTSFKPQDDYLQQQLGELPPDYFPSRDYPGDARLIVPTIRTVLNPGETFTLEVICANMEVEEARLYYRAFGERRYKWLSLDHQQRAVYQAKLSFDDTEPTGFDWYVDVKDTGGREFLYPSGGAHKPASVTRW